MSHLMSVQTSTSVSAVALASASMLMEKIEGKTIDEIKAFSATQMLELYGPRLTPNRQKCCLLSWKVVQSALYSPIDADGTSNATFSGPDLGEES